MSDLALAILGGAASLVFGLIATIYALSMREINLLRKRCHELATHLTAVKTDVEWIERELERRTREGHRTE